MQELDGFGCGRAPLSDGDGNLFGAGGAACDEDTVNMRFHWPHLGMGDLKEPVRPPG